jgi:uncharacterized protein YcbK (DUF882 family)
MEVRFRPLAVVALSVFAMMMASWPNAPSARAGQSPGRGAARFVHHTHTFEPVDAPRLRSFTIRSVNTNEAVTVAMNGDIPEPESAQKLAHLARCLRTQNEHELDPRLVRVLADIADETGGDIELISAYRAPKSGHDHNFHTQGMAADIRVKGMRAWDLKRTANALAVPGLGYYPTTKMIHVDVRDTPYRWTDWSGPSW